MKLLCQVLLYHVYLIFFRYIYRAIVVCVQATVEWSLGIANMYVFCGVLLVFILLYPEKSKRRKRGRKEGREKRKNYNL